MMQKSRAARSLIDTGSLWLSLERCHEVSRVRVEGALAMAKIFLQRDMR
jgi:hypothetical protein